MNLIWFWICFNFNFLLVHFRYAIVLNKCPALHHLSWYAVPKTILKNVHPQRDTLPRNIPMLKQVFVREGQTRVIYNPVMRKFRDIKMLEPIAAVPEGRRTKMFVDLPLMLISLKQNIFEKVTKYSQSILYLYYISFNYLIVAFGAYNKIYLCNNVHTFCFMSNCCFINYY